MIHAALRVVCCSAAAALSATLCHAQAEVAVRPPVDARALGNTAASVEIIDDVLWGFGARYKAAFGESGVRMTPALGDRAPHNVSIDLGLQSIGRGAHLTPVTAPTARSHERLRVTYDRPEVSERFDVRDAGIEQSFLFEVLPPGSGDLVIRASLETEFEVSRHGDGLALELAGVGRLLVGGVTAIDANGASTRGALTYVDGAMELRVPAAFVEQAALPLLVDPFVGGTLQSFTGVNTRVDTNPDVAYDATTDVYLVVYERIWSATDRDVHAQRVDGDGNFVGGRIFVANAPIDDSRGPRVANVNQTNTFVVAWWNDGPDDVKARVIDAATGGLNGTELAIAVGAQANRQPDVGGETSTADNDAIVTWQNTSTGSVMAAQVQTSNNTFFGVTTIYSSGAIPPSNPRISSGNGQTGYHMIAFDVDFGADHDPRAVIIDRNIGLLDDDVIFPISLDDDVEVAVEGEGRSWIAAWATEEPGNPASYDIVCQSVTVDASRAVGDFGVLFSNVQSVTADANDLEYAPTVTWTGGSTLIGWSDVDGSAINTYFRSVDPLSCAACESAAQFTPGNNPGDDYRMGAGSKVASGGPEDDALLVWDNDNTAAPAGDADLLGRRWASADGSVTQLGGGCGADAGQSYAACAVAGNANFALRLVSQLPNTPAVLVISRQYSGLPCGGCTLAPDPYTGWIAPLVTDNASRAALAVAIPAVPALTGTYFYAQWLVSEPVTPGCYLFGSDLTNALRLTIE
ncbi:MAG: hypothetical protein ACON4Z_06500 [Planctomycetota bacterium]